MVTKGVCTHLGISIAVNSNWAMSRARWKDIFLSVVRGVVLLVLSFPDCFDRLRERMARAT